MYDAVFFTECNGSVGWGRDAGCYTVSSRLREQGYTTKVIDFFSHFNFERFKNAINLYVNNQTLFLGFSSTHFSTLKPEDWNEYWKTDNRSKKHAKWHVYFPFEPEEMQEWINHAKSKFPNLKIIVGGQKVAQKRALQKKYPFVDIWVGGMADISIIEITKKLKDKKTLPNIIKSELDFGGITENNFKRSKIHWDKSDLIFPGEAVPLEITRGCPFDCAFCDYRKKETGSWILDKLYLRDLLIVNYEKFKINHYMITDFLINENSTKMEMIADIFTSLPFKISWTGFARLDILNSRTDMIHQMYESGCKSIQFGIETITDRVGPLIGKVTRRKTIETALQNCTDVFKNDVIMGSGFVIGLPGETMRSCQEVINWIHTQPWLKAWEITPLFIGDYSTEKAYTIDYSRIQKNPKEFGYDVSVTLNDKGDYVEEWSNGDMTKSKIIKLIEQAQTSELWKKRLMTSYVNYSRCSNLGFSHKEMLHANKYNLQWIQDHAQKYLNLGAKYLKQNNL